MDDSREDAGVLLEKILAPDGSPSHLREDFPCAPAAQPARYECLPEHSAGENTRFGAPKRGFHGFKMQGNRQKQAKIGFVW